MDSLKTNKNGESQQYENQMEAHIIPGETPSKKTGRRIGYPVQYQEDEYEGLPYVIGTCRYKDTNIEFYIDKDDYERIRTRHWYAISGGKYIGCKVNINNVSKVLGLHNFIMNKLDFPGKGAKETVDHINRNGLDNRKSNLRIISQTLQNVNQKKKKRTATLPEGIADLPKHIWYIKAQGLHGDRFAVELKTEKIVRKTTSSKSVNIQDKLKEALRIREELYAEYPYLRSE